MDEGTINYEGDNLEMEKDAQRKSYDEKSPLRVFNWHWYKDQMSGWTKSSYIWLTIGLLSQLVIGLGHGVTPLGVASTIAGMIGFTCTIAITNGRSINGLLGFISAAIIRYVTTPTGNYSDIAMQLAYIILLDIPVLLDTSWTDKTAKKMNGKNVAQTVIVFAIFWAATYFLDTVLLHSPQAFLDSLAATIGLTGAVLTVGKFRASYYFWTAQGLMSIALWIQTALNGHPVWVLMWTYCLYIGNDILAFADSPWFKDKKHNESKKADTNKA